MPGCSERLQGYKPPYDVVEGAIKIRREPYAQVKIFQNCSQVAFQNALVNKGQTQDQQVDGLENDEVFRRWLARLVLEPAPLQSSTAVRDAVPFVTLP